ncbi:MAG: porin family protein [Pseudomonadales bacterium]
MKIRTLLAALVLGLFGATAQAETDRGFYLGSGIGMYYVDIDGIDLDQSAPNWRAFGGYTLNKYLSFEAGYSHLFEVSDDILGVDVEMDGDAFDVMVRPTLPIGDRFEAFAILGYSWYDWNISASFQGQSVDDSANDDDLIYGVGGAFRFGDRWSLRGEWTMVDVSDADFGSVTASVSYSFR